MPLAVPDESLATPQLDSARTQRLSPPANRLSCFRSRCDIPSPPPHGALDETDRPCPAAAKSAHSQTLDRRVWASRSSSRLRSIGAPLRIDDPATHIASIPHAHRRLSWGPAASVLKPMLLRVSPEHRSRPA